MEVRERKARGEDFLLLDVRSGHARAFDPQQIPGARWVPLSDVVQCAETFPRDAAIIAYCT